MNRLLVLAVVSLCLAGSGCRRAPKVMPLQEALDDGICTMEVSTRGSGRYYMTFVLSPGPDCEEDTAIGIGPGWRVVNKGDDRKWAEHVSIFTKTNSVWKDGSFIYYSLLSVRTSTNYALRVPDQFKVDKLPGNHELMKLLTTVNERDPLPSWNAVQIAVWIMNEDIGLEQIKKEIYWTGKHSGMVWYNYDSPYPVLADNVVPIDNALALLTDAGLVTSQYRVKTDIDKTLKKAVTDYAADDDAWKAIHNIGFLHPRKEATALLLSVLKERKSGQDDINTRRDAVEFLDDHLTDEVVDAVREALKTEDADSVREVMKALLKNAEPDTTH